MKYTNCSFYRESYGTKEVKRLTVYEPLRLKHNILLRGGKLFVIYRVNMKKCPPHPILHPNYILLGLTYQNAAE